jgi:SAM-dependent methyltransferase
MSTATQPSPETFFETMSAYQQTAALKAAVELELFTAIGEGAETVTAIAKRCAASERGIRILCDYLTIIHLLTKSGDRYQLTLDSSVFLTKTSPAYLGGTLAFLASPDITRNFDALASTVRRGTLAVDASTVAGHEQAHWVEFARAMAPMMMPAAMAIADVLKISAAGPVRILDIAAGHGIFGITLAQRNPRAEVVALDWAGVLAVASDNATRMGVKDRYRLLPGDAFKVVYGTGYDIALLTNFLHHFDVATNTALLRRVAAALKPGGKVAILEFVPDDDRTAPPFAAGFSLTMLAGTPAGDTYTLSQLRQMATDAGFSGVSGHPIPPTPNTVVVATK